MSINSCILPSTYLGPVSYYGALIKHENIQIEHWEHFVKQTHRSRCCIYGANGILKLIIPLLKHHDKTPMSELQIDYSTNWQKLHWKSIESAYRSSPYFEYYEHDFIEFYQTKKIKSLTEFNQSLFMLTLKLLKTKPTINYTDQYNQDIPEVIDYRNDFDDRNEKTGSKIYKQVFDDKHGFINDLSIIDLIFNLGPDSKEYLLLS